MGALSKRTQGWVQLEQESHQGLRSLGMIGWDSQKEGKERQHGRKEVFIQFVDSFGHPVLFADGLRGKFREEKANISEVWLDREGGFLVSFLEPSIHEHWRPTIDFSVYVGSGVDLTAEVDLGSLNQTSGETIIVKLIPEYDSLLSGYVVDDNGEPIRGARVVYFRESRPEDILGEAYTLSGGGFWIDGDIEDLPVLLSVVCDGYVRVNQVIEKGGEKEPIILKKGSPVVGQLFLPEGVAGATLEFRFGLEVHSSAVDIDGKFVVFGVWPGEWEVNFIRNAISISLGSVTCVYGKELQIDARPFSKAIWFEVVSLKSGETIPSIFVFETNEKVYQEIPLDDFNPVIVPHGVSKGTVVSAGHLDQEVILESSSLRVALEPGILVDAHLVVPQGIHGIDVGIVSFRSVHRVRGKLLLYDLVGDIEPGGLDFAGVICSPAEYEIYVLVMNLGLPIQFTKARLLEANTGAERVSVEQGLPSSFELVFAPEWLEKVKPLLELRK